MGSRPWLFWVTWRHRSRDHSNCGSRLPMGGPLWPRIYLTLLWRYGHLEFFQENSSRNRGRSLVGWSSILHWSQILLFSKLRMQRARSKKEHSLPHLQHKQAAHIPSGASALELF